MKKLLYKIYEENGRTIYEFRTYQTYIFSIGLLAMFIGYFTSKWISVVGLALIIFNIISKILGAGVTSQLLKYNREGKLTATGNKHSFKYPLRIIYDPNQNDETK